MVTLHLPLLPRYYSYTAVITVRFYPFQLHYRRFYRPHGDTTHFYGYRGKYCGYGGITELSIAMSLSGEQA